MNEIRQRIIERLNELGLTQSWLSTQLNRNLGYIHDYIGGRPEDLPYEIKIKVAHLLKLPPRELGVEPIVPQAPKPFGGGMCDDAVPYEPPTQHFLARSPHIAYFRMTTLALDQHPERIKPGHLLAFDLNTVHPDTIDTGRIVIAQLFDKKELTKTHGTVIRQFVAPNKLITNSSENNEIISLDDPSLPYEAVIKWALISVMREVN